VHHSRVSVTLAERLWDGMHAADLAAVPVFGGWIDRHNGYDVVRLPSLPLPDLNSVWADREIDPGTLASEVARIEADGVPAGVLTWQGRTPGVEAAARSLGLTVDDPNAGMALAPSGLHVPDVPDVEVVRVDAKGLPEAQRVAETGFGVTEGLLAPNYSPAVAAFPGIACYVGHARGRAVSTAIGFTFGDLVCIYAVATPAEHRGRGYGAAVTARAVADGFANGAELALLAASPMGEPVYRRLGFREVLRYVLYRRPG
jgi:GNAT superfamily N-acetyltransferase